MTLLYDTGSGKESTVVSSPSLTKKRRPKHAKKDGWPSLRRLAAGAEEGLEQLAAAVGEDALDHRDPVVEALLVHDVEDRTAGAGDRVVGAVDDAGDARVDQRARAHGARLERHVNFRAFQAPVLERLGGLGDGDHLGVGRRVVEGLDLVVGPAEDMAFMDDDGADGDFARLRRALR